MGYKTLISLHREKTRDMRVREGCGAVENNRVNGCEERFLASESDFAFLDRARKILETMKLLGPYHVFGSQNIAFKWVTRKIFQNKGLDSPEVLEHLRTFPLCAFGIQGQGWMSQGSGFLLWKSPISLF